MSTPRPWSWDRTAAERVSEGEYDAAEFSFQREADVYVDPAQHRRSSLRDIAEAVVEAEKIDPHCPGAALMRAERLSHTLGEALEHYREAATRALERMKISAPDAVRVITLAEKEENLDEDRYT